MKTNWKAKLQTVLENKQKSEPSSKTALTVTDNITSFKKDLSAIVSDNLPLISENFGSNEEVTKELPLPNFIKYEVPSAFVSGHLPYSVESFQSMAKKKTNELHKILNQLIGSGIRFDIALTDFLIVDNDKRLTDYDSNFLNSNYESILCELQQSILAKNLFHTSPERLENFIFEIAERESILTETDEISFEIYCEAVIQTTRKWFAELLREI